ncbi:DUF3795 domain-containing protein, partial [candidate division WOR-3 bacterium]|nr:DUF3795 domain-containing protein [candidate division WOR-3 bacterium]
MARMTTKTLGYCGARCPTCFAYRKNVSEAAKALRRELRAEKLKESWKEFPFLADYASFKKSLDGLAMLRCTKMCRGGGGNPWCKIRRCAQARMQVRSQSANCKVQNGGQTGHQQRTRAVKGLAGCWECEESDACKKLLPAYRPNLERIR